MTVMTEQEEGNEITEGRQQVTGCTACQKDEVFVKLKSMKTKANNIPRHVRIKKLSAKAKNNILLVDWREKNVSIHVYLDVSVCKTEQRPHWTSA